MKKVGIIGAGLAGLSCAKALLAAGYSVDIFEKSRGPGGRMANRRFDDTDLDFGAPYFTARSPEFIEEVDAWCEAGRCAPWTVEFGIWQGGQTFVPEKAPVRRFVGVPRMTSVARLMAKQMSVRSETRIEQIAGSAGNFQLISKNASFGPFDALVVTTPRKQAADLLSTTDRTLVDVPDIEMLPCYATMLVLDSNPVLPYQAFFTEHKILRYCALNNSKPGRSAVPSSWLLHGRHDWSADNIEADIDEIGGAMTDAFFEIAGESPKVLARSTHRWMFAFAAKPAEQTAIWNADSRVGIAGDWVADGRVEGAYMSGLALARRICASDGM